MLEDMYSSLGISKEVLTFGKKIEKELSPRFQKIDETAEYNQLKVLLAMQKKRVSDHHISSVATGYGYNDNGRDTLEEVYADIFHTESALVRPQITCGTHAISTALFAMLRPGDELLAVTGKPYDTMDEIIGIRPANGSLAEYGISYAQADLDANGMPDYEKIRSLIKPNTKLAEIQRSKGYAVRPSYGVKEIGEMIAFLKSIKPDLIVLVDNCYGEFVEEIEPTDVGADLIAGSLIKNPGGGLAPIGGYIAGKKEFVEACGYHLIAPGLGREVGASLDTMRSFYQGLFFSPTVTASAEKSAIFAASVFEKLGFSVLPGGEEERHDIIQSVVLRSAQAVEAFCRGIQKAAPINSYVTPIPGDMPGYDSQVIMAAGAFVQGSSIELSADAPMKEPYAVYFQGGLTWQHGKFGILKALQELVTDKIVTLP